LRGAAQAQAFRLDRGPRGRGARVRPHGPGHIRSREAAHHRSAMAARRAFRSATARVTPRARARRRPRPAFAISRAAARDACTLEPGALVATASPAFRHGARLRRARRSRRRGSRGVLHCVVEHVATARRVSAPGRRTDRAALAARAASSRHAAGAGRSIPRRRSRVGRLPPSCWRLPTRSHRPSFSRKSRPTTPLSQPTETPPRSTENRLPAWNSAATEWSFSWTRRPL
jgi:hypothetical protein